MVVVVGLCLADSSSDRSDERKSGDFDAKQELGLSETVKSIVGFEGTSGF